MFIRAPNTPNSFGVVNNNFIIKFMQYKDTSQQAFLNILFYNLFTFHLVDLEFSP